MEDYESDYDILKQLEEMPKRKPEKQIKASSRRQFFIQQTADMLGVNFKTVLWKTILWPEDWIGDFHQYCLKNGKPPARLWWGLIKKSNATRLTKGK